MEEVIVSGNVIDLGFTKEEIEEFEYNSNRNAPRKELEDSIGKPITHIDANCKLFNIFADKYNPLFLIAKSEDDAYLYRIKRMANLTEDEIIYQVEEALRDEEELSANRRAEE